MSTQKHVVIVDAYSPTRRLAPVLHEAGYAVVRVQSTPGVPLVYQSSFDLSPYAANIVHDGDLEATIAAVAAFEPEAVIAGGEVGVEFADLLAERMGLAGNGTALSAARRDKYVQMETVRAAGVRATRQLLVTDAAQLADWHRDFGGRVVVKPLRSAAGDGVAFCSTPEESVAAYEAILGAENVFSARNDGVVAQEYLAGGEYIVDIVSREGRHHVTDVWKYEKISANGILDLTTGLRILPRRGDAQDALVPYAFEVLDALGVQYGASHLEIKLTPEGPCLVEAAARMAGLDIPFYSRECIGEAHLEWIVDAYVRPDRFDARWKDDYRLNRHWVSAMAVSTVDAELAGYPLLPVIEGLESFQDVRPVVSPGGRLRPTIDDMTCPLIVNFAHEVEEIAIRDFGTVRHLDGPAFYELAGES
ncbi:ATP-grasp domain-containing protein [Phytomonospora sp. NPDC050363]|uniref:ATP-grasp domain-containing protein n=1 Tax=Phytomonospora sp. NPDC050363 TaxID=3155642 RepID=UPI0033C206DE